MTWARFDDGFPQHPKIVGLSDQAFRLHVSAVCYANQNLTDGLIHGSQLPLLLHGRPAAAIKRRALELLEAGVWETAKDGCYQIHDFLIYNKPRSDVLAKRQQNAMAGAKGAAKRWHGEPHSEPMALSVRSQNGPSPSPDPGSLQTTTSPLRSARQLYEHVVGRAVGQNKALRDELDKQMSHGAECVNWAWALAVDAEKPLPYVRKILQTCSDEGHGPHRGEATAEPDDMFEGRR